MTSSSACEDRVLKDSTDLHIHVTPDSSPGWWSFHCLVLHDLCGYTENYWNVRPSYSVLRPSFFLASSWNKDVVGWGWGATDALPLFSVPVAGRVVLHCLLCVSAVGCSAEAEALLTQFPFLSPVAVAVTLLARSDAFTQFLKHSWANLSVFNSHLGDP